MQVALTGIDAGYFREGDNILTGEVDFNEIKYLRIFVLSRSSLYHLSYESLPISVYFIRSSVST